MKNTKNLTLWFCWSILFILIASSLQHFLYDWTQSVFVSLWAPVNESVWEHLKIIFYPILMWWLIFYIVGHKKYELDINNWIVGAVSSAIIAMLGIVFLYYFIFSGLAVGDNNAIHIIIEIVSIILGQSVGYHIASRAKVNKSTAIIFISLSIIIIMILAIFTFLPPNAPLFIDYSV
jgi:hypothetical protein